MDGQVTNQNVEQQQQQVQQQPAVSGSALEQLAREAGLVPPQQQQVTQQAPAQELPPEVATLNNYFQQAYGVDLDGFAATVNEIQQWRVQQQVLNNQNQLRQEWGNDYDNRIKVVQEKLKTLDPNTAQSLDTIEGAKLLYQLAYLEQVAQQQGQTRQQPPAFPQGMNQQRSMTGQSGQYTVKQSDLANPITYRQLAEKYGAQNPNWESDLWNQGQVYMDLR